MINEAKKRNKFFTREGELIRSQKSRLARAQKSNLPLNEAIDCNDADFVDFLKVFIIR